MPPAKKRAPVEQQEPAAEWVPIAKLLPWLKNPRKNDPAVPAVVESIREFGFGAPLVARRANGEIIAGHTRLKAAKILGLKSVPVRFLDLTEQQAHALALADNKLGEIAEWDNLGLAALLAEMPADEANLVGWTNAELDRLLSKLRESSEAAEPDEPEVAVDGEVHSEPGVLYELGPHRLLCGDCRNERDVARLIDRTKIAVAITSPPYAAQRVYDEGTEFKPIHPDEYEAWFEPVQANVARVLADDGSWFLNIKEHVDDGQRSLYVKKLTIAHVERWGWLFVDEFCWRNTQNGFPGAYPTRFKNAWEPVFHFARAGVKFRPEGVSTESGTSFAYDAAGNKHIRNRGYVKDDSRGSAAVKFRPDAVLQDSEHCFAYSKETHKDQREQGWIKPPKKAEEGRGLARPSNVLEVAPSGHNGHPAPFPLGLPNFFIRAFSDRADAIFDPFLGSGTTLIAAAELGRVCFGTEISPRYCDVIRRRWTAFARNAKIDPGTGALEPVTA